MHDVNAFVCHVTHFAIFSLFKLGMVFVWEFHFEPLYRAQQIFNRVYMLLLLLLFKPWLRWFHCDARITSVYLLAI